MIAFVGAVASDVGNVREVNQDRGFMGPNTFVVADGMGGHRGGEVAAILAVSKFEEAPPLLKEGDLKKLAHEANALVYERAFEDDLRGMGTTLVAIALQDGQSVSVINIGDSRAYWLRDGYLAQVTRDHSFVGDLLNSNEITEEQALSHPKRNIITRALGISEEVEVDEFSLNVEVGDRFILCSDGLTDEVTESQMCEILVSEPDPKVVVKTLVQMALDNGGKDNVTVAVVDVVASDDAELSDSDDLEPTQNIEDEKPPSLLDVKEKSSTSDDEKDDDDSKKESVFFSDEGKEDKASESTQEYNIEDFLRAGTADSKKETKAKLNTVTDNNENGFNKSGYLVAGISFLFMCLIAGFFLIRAQARSSWFVAIDDKSNTVAIYEGKPGGFLGFNPIKKADTGITSESVSAVTKSHLQTEPEFDSLYEAREYVDTIEPEKINDKKADEPVDLVESGDIKKKSGDENEAP